MASSPPLARISRYVPRVALDAQSDSGYVVRGMSKVP